MHNLLLLIIASFAQFFSSSFDDASQGQGKTFGSKDYVPYLDCSDSPTGVNSLKSCHIELIELVTNRRYS